MDLKLAENIKRFRKEMELTQEALAEALGVTVGAVSKWENGNNVPDVLTMMELANFYNVSVDELLGYTMSSKKVDDMCEEIKKLYYELNFEEALIEAGNALARYPHNFKVLYTAANARYYKAFTSPGERDSEIAIELFNSALSCISQNTDPEITEFSIKNRIADLYIESDPEKALEELKKINYDNINSLRIAQVFQKMDKRRESLEYYSNAFVYYLINLHTLLVTSANMIASSEKEQDLKTALSLSESGFLLLDAFGISDTVNYLYKLKSSLLIQKAWWLACLKRTGEMHACVEEAYRMADLYDKEADSKDLASALKFLVQTEIHVFDSIGASAVSGIDAIFDQILSEMNGRNAAAYDEVRNYWEETKEKNSRRNPGA